MYSMLLVEKFFQTFFKKGICDAGKSTEVLVALAVESRADEDGMAARALAAGGVEPAELAQAIARAEQFTGIDCGEMDQAVSVLGEKVKLLKIDFFPLRIESAPLPPGYTVVVANSMVEAAKTLDAKTAYNTRHTVCKLATALLCRRLELDGGRVENHAGKV